MAYIRPFLKWAGGKHRVLDHIIPELNTRPSGRLIEPFMGSGVVWLNAPQKEVIANDINVDLVSLYQTLAAQGEVYIQEAMKQFSSENNTKEQYAKLKKKFNTLPFGPERAALFIYFNRHGFNGMCRYNSRGEFNIPFGQYANPSFPEVAMRQWLEVIKNKQITFQQKNFVEVMLEAKHGDVIYADPPYVPLSTTASFTQYAKEGFDATAQQQLANLANELADKGIKVVISNHDNEITRKLYENATRIEAFSVRRSISAKASSRVKASELLAVWE